MTMMNMLRPTVFYLVLSLTAAACAVSPSRAALSATQPPQMAPNAPGEFVWHDLVTDNPASSRAFYGALFGWTFEPGDGVDPGYMMIKHQGTWIGGIVQRRAAGPDAGGAQWLSYVVVQDVDRAAEAFKSAGGRIFRGPLNARKDLRVAAVADAQGGVLGLASRGPNFRTTSAAGLNEWLWMEYVARDADSALSFYGDALGFRHEVSERVDNFTYYLLSTDRPRAGLFRSVWTQDQSAWLPYIRVEDPTAMAARVKDLGGTIVLAPQARARGGSLAIVLDPSGAALALQKYPFDKGVTQ